MGAPTAAVWPPFPMLRAAENPVPLASPQAAAVNRESHAGNLTSIRGIFLHSHLSSMKRARPRRDGLLFKLKDAVSRYCARSRLDACALSRVRERKCRMSCFGRDFRYKGEGRGGMPRRCRRRRARAKEGKRENGGEPSFTSTADG